ncbi:MAG TPA: hypothetical protein VEB39_00935 [Sphingomicrobium sp.]|nr:hypothetical protein [Sphingomicrobium sp.]
MTLAFFATIFWLYWKSKRPKQESQPVSDDPDQPYTIFAREFDLELQGLELDRRLVGASPDYQNGWLKLSKDRWRDEIHLADQLVEEHRESFRSMLGSAATFGDRAVTILIDQSGSMQGEPIRWAAVASRLAAEVVLERGAEVEILGFSTAGWRGGFAYQKWQDAGRPKRPGRLCSVLHIVYKSRGEQIFDRANWEAMLNPNALRENVDGEALEWAATRLRQSPAEVKQLIVLSDGAPVDDATYFHNGGGYLVRHLRSVISDIESDGAIDLSAIGIRHAVDEYYGRSTSIDDLTQLPELLAKWLSMPAQEAVK